MKPAAETTTTDSTVQFKKKKRPVDGVLLLDKPAGLTSNAALQSARRLYNAAKAGHTGTLDPMATGLLPVAFGEATKFTQMMLDADKTYLARIRFGSETDTGDAEGAVISTRQVRVDKAMVEKCLAGFRGDIEQIPPMYSALKHNGKPLYEYARMGIELERKTRTVSIRSLKLLSFDQEHILIEVDCSKGTYIRTLAIDIGRELGCGGHLESLRRTRIGPFSVENAITLDMLGQVDNETARDALLAPTDELVQHFAATELGAEQASALLHGQPLNISGEKGISTRLYASGAFLGLGEWREDGRLWPRRLVATHISK